MSYRAPVEDILFTLRHVAGLDRLIADGLAPDLEGDLADAVLEEAGRFATEKVAPLNRVGDKDGSRPQGRQGHHAARLEGDLRGMGGRRLERPRGAGRAWRAGPAEPRAVRPASRCGTPPPWRSRWARC